MHVSSSGLIRRSYNGSMNHGYPSRFMALIRLTRFTAIQGFAVFLVFSSLANLFAGTNSSAVTSPPDSFFQKVRERDREAARQFYKKYLEVDGLPVAAVGEVADQALERTSYIVTHMLAGRPDIIQAMVSNGMYLIVIGKNQ